MNSIKTILLILIYASLVSLSVGVFIINSKINELNKEITYVQILPHQTTQFIATGYSIGYPYNDITKDGSPVINTGFIKVGNLQIFTVATDPNVIPLGSLIYIDSLGIGMCTDTGRKIKGYKIDVCFPTMIDAMNWGVRKVNVTVLQRKD